MEIVLCGESRLEELAGFVVGLNDQPEHHIGYFGAGETDIRFTLGDLYIPAAKGFQLAYENGKVVGIFGVDANAEIARAWLFGPLINHPNWGVVAEELLVKILPLIPQGTREQELYCDSKNINLQRFAEKHLFPLRSETAVRFLTRKAFKQDQKTNVSSEIRIGDFENAFFDRFQSLHGEIFPNTYMTAAQIVKEFGKNRRLIAAFEKENISGYCYCKTEADFGYIDFIGTAENSRGKGIASALLQTGIVWMFSNQAVTKIMLTVHTDSKPANALYTKFGFETERILRGYRKMLNV